MQEKPPIPEIKADSEKKAAGFTALLAEIEPWQKFDRYAEENPMLRDFVEKLRVEISEIYVPAIVMETLQEEASESDYLELIAGYKDSHSLEELAERLSNFSPKLIEKIKHNLTAELEHILDSLQPTIESAIKKKPQPVKEEARG